MRASSYTRSAICAERCKSTICGVAAFLHLRIALGIGNRRLLQNSVRYLKTSLGKHELSMRVALASNEQTLPARTTDYAIAEKTTSYWANFVKTGNPNGDRLANWPALDVNNPVTMELGDRFEVRPIADTAQVKLLEEILTQAASSTGR